MPYNSVSSEGFHTKKLCSRLSSSEVQFYGCFAFWAPTEELSGNIHCSS